MTRNKILNDLIDLRYATINNFAYRTSKTEKDDVRQAEKHFFKLEKEKFIKEIYRHPMADRRNKKYSRFYAVTKKGFKAVSRLDEFEDIEYSDDNMFFHECMIRDICMSFKKLYPLWTWDFHFGKKIHLGETVTVTYETVKKKENTKDVTFFYPDVYITGQYSFETKNGIKTINDSFLLEMEHKDNPSAVYREKYPLYETLTDEVLKTHGIHPKVKKCVVYAQRKDLGGLAYRRYQEHPKYIEKITCMAGKFENLVGKFEHTDFYLLPFYSYHKFNWWKGGKLTKLI